MDSDTTLKRSLSLPLITFYGLGTIIGAGIYVLIGEVAGKAGIYAPMAFILAAIVAGFSAFSFAELSSRLPQSAGEAVYVQEAFGRQWFSTLIGCAVVTVGMLSSATVANGFVGYLEVFIQLPSWLAITLLVLGMGVIAAWGISESVWTATVITILEIGGLLFVLIIAGDSLADLPARWAELIPPLQQEIWVGIFSGAFLAYFAYIGFEDMVNVAEEVKDVQRLLPKAIILALFISTLLYVAVALVAVLALPIDTLAKSNAPLTTVLQAHNQDYGDLISAISLIAVVNGALIQIIMASRVIYGMSSNGLIPGPFGKINTRTRTPLRATVLVTIIILILALLLHTVTLAQISSFISLCIFTSINLALIKLKHRQPRVANSVSYPLWVPVSGAILSLIFLTIELSNYLF